MEIAASIKGASKEYKTGDTIITALEPTTSDFMKKELTLILGPSGSGKTTLLSLLGCVIFPTKGEVYIDNILVNNLTDKELARVRLKKIGFVFQYWKMLCIR
jgi:putative ABC transport system ATP-binding protein